MEADVIRSFFCEPLTDKNEADIMSKTVKNEIKKDKKRKGGDRICIGS